MAEDNNNTKVTEQEVVIPQKTEPEQSVQAEETKSEEAAPAIADTPEVTTPEITKVETPEPTPVAESVAEVPETTDPKEATVPKDISKAELPAELKTIHSSPPPRDSPLLQEDDSPKDHRECEKLRDDAITFLETGSVRDAPAKEKQEFLQSKGLTAAEAQDLILKVHGANGAGNGNGKRRRSKSRGKASMNQSSQVKLLNFVSPGLLTDYKRSKRFHLRRRRNSQSFRCSQPPQFSHIPNGLRPLRPSVHAH